LGRGRGRGGGLFAEVPVQEVDLVAAQAADPAGQGGVRPA
jgi:hypothetical protein